jgi:hypothetical protein
MSIESGHVRQLLHRRWDATEQMARDYADAGQAAAAARAHFGEG